MKSSLPDIQSMLFTTLSNYTDLTNAVDGIYINKAPDGSEKYVLLGEDTVSNWGTHTFDGEEVTHTLHVWHPSSPHKCKQIMSLVIEALTQPSLSIGDGFFMEFSQLDFMQVFDDPSDWKHGVVRFRFKISQ